MKRRKFLEIAKNSWIGLALALIGHKKQPEPEVAEVTIETSVNEEALGGFLIPPGHADFLKYLKEKGFAASEITVNFGCKEYHDETTKILGDCG